MEIFRSDSSSQLSPSQLSYHDAVGAAPAPMSPTPRAMPDIARDGQGHPRTRLDRVGMQHVEVPVCIEGSDGRLRELPAVADVFVSLDDPEAKGIHMSRLFLALQDTLESNPLNVSTMRLILERFLATHEGLSHTASVAIRYDWMVKRSALVSDKAGYRTYPVELRGELHRGQFRFFMHTRVVYSSTCPCSAALARQLIQEQFGARFGAKGSVAVGEVREWLGTADGIVATPHSQRSHAEVTVELEPAGEVMSAEELVGRVEQALRTAVQAAVKREDEQAFALVNGQNLMFCEDAARRVQSTLEEDTRVLDYRVQASHFESLHPHDAVSIVTKGKSGGMRP
jgi:GTP cyclohydrolase I